MKRTKTIHNINFKLAFYFSIILFSIVPSFLSLSTISAQKTELEFKNNVETKQAGTYYFIVSENTRMTFEVWGGGGKGGSRSSVGVAGGGGGGAYARKTIDLVKGDTIDIIVGAGGSDTSINGQISEVKLNNVLFLKADGGVGVANNTSSGGTGGTIANSIGDIRHSGGNGANGSGTNGGGGGSSGGPAANGSNGSGNSGGTAPSNGGNGGGGRSGGLPGDGNPGLAPGGGGGGAYRFIAGGTGGNGGSGQVRIMNMCRAYWFKADIPADILPTHGGDLSIWKDRTENENHGYSYLQSDGNYDNTYTASTSYPKWYDNKINFNPAVEFTNGYYLTNRRSVGNDMALYVVFSTTQTDASNNWWQMPSLTGGDVSGQNDWGFAHSAGKLFFKSTENDGVGDNPQTTNAYNTGQPTLASGFRKMGDKSYIHVNGVQQAEKSAGGVSLTGTTKVGVGRNPTIGGTSQFKGFIAEVSVLNNMCSPTDKAINDTYFAIKYGITLAHDYKRRHAKDSVIYSVETHNHDIAGLGRQDFTLELHQKISSSSNVPVGTLGRVVISTSNDFTGSNVTANHQGIEDGQYLIWGHNNEGAGWTQINDKLKRQNRVWKIQNTSNANGKFVSGTYFQIDLNDGTIFPPIDSNIKSEVYAILMSENSDFSGELDYVPLIPDNTNLYSAAVDFPEGVSYFTVARMNKNYWTGAINSDWNNVNNWGSMFVPPSMGEVVYATEDNYGTAAQNDIIISGGTHATIKDVFNTTDKNLIIEANASLTLNGVVSITDATNPAKIQIRADDTNPNGSIILNSKAQNASAQKDVYASIQMHVKGQKLPAEQTWVDNISGSPTEGQTFSTEYSWQFFGAPVQSIRAEPTFYGAAIRQYFENYNGEDNSQFYQKWKTIYNENNLEAFKGYEITQDIESSSIYTIEGKLVYGEQTLTMTRKAPLVSEVRYGLGQNIFGNSFTSAIKIDNIEFPPEAEHTVYLYNTGSFADWGDATNTNTGAQSAGQYTAIPKLTANYDGQIPSMNGFLVRFLPEYTNYSEDDTFLFIQYTNETVEKNTKPQTAPRKKLSWLEIVLSGDTSFDKLWLYSQDGTTADFDNGWDGFKFFGTPHAFIFTETEAGPMQVDTDETIHGKLISFYANKNGIYTLHLIRDQLQGYEFLHLLDLETQQTIAIDRDTVSYTFTANSEGQIMRRFSLVDSPFPNMDKGDWALLSAFTYPPNKLSVQNFTTLPGTLRIYDTGGRLVMQENINKVSTNFTLPFQAGVYLIHMQAGAYRAVEKVVVY